MGYESRVYIVNEWDRKPFYIENEKPLAETIAVFDLCCIENKLLDVLTNKAEEASCAIWNSDGDGDIIITKDKYDKPLTSAGILDVYNAIEYGEYWRTTALKDFLHSIIVNRDILSRDFESLKVYHYGY